MAINKKGVTLLELMIFISIFTIVMAYFCQMVNSAQKYSSSKAFKLSLKVHSLLLFNRLLSELDNISQEQIYPVYPQNSSYIEFRKMESITEEGKILWGNKIRVGMKRVYNSENALLMKYTYDDDDVNIIRSEILSHYLLIKDSSLNLHGLSFTRALGSNLLHLSLSFKKTNNKGESVYVNYQGKVNIKN